MTREPSLHFCWVYVDTKNPARRLMQWHWTVEPAERTNVGDPQQGEWVEVPTVDPKGTTP